MYEEISNNFSLKKDDVYLLHCDCNVVYAPCVDLAKQKKNIQKSIIMHGDKSQLERQLKAHGKATGVLYAA